MVDLILITLTSLMVLGYIVVVVDVGEPCLLSRSREDRKQYMATRRNRLLLLLIFTLVVIGLGVAKINSG